MEADALNLMIGFPGPTELIIIFVIILVLFGGAKLPEMARNLGRGMRVFKEEANALRREIELADKVTPADKDVQETDQADKKDKTDKDPKTVDPA